MRKNLVFLSVLLLSLPAFSQYWQQQTDYRIDVTLEPATRTLDGFEQLRYTNHSPDTLFFIWFHLWPNAYKNDRTAFSDQLLENGNTRFYFSGPEDKGYINRLDFKVNGQTARTEDHPEHIDIVKLLLPHPLPPGGQALIATPFHVKLPFNVSRGGFSGNSFQVTQWYPKPAVYDRKGWHPMPYLDQGEFYSEFGSFDVTITLPRNFVVAATGALQTAAEKDWLKTRSALPAPAPDRESKTLRYVQDRVHDFAWFADPAFIVNSDTCRLPSGKLVEVSTFYTPAQAASWKNSLAYAKAALRFYSDEVGEYPYATLSAVQGPASFGGGMEYPTITVLSPSGSTKELDLTLAHEIGHNWFYGILASNERTHPWMDEGLNTFYERKYARQRYGGPDPLEEIAFQTLAKTRRDQPIETPADRMSELNYGLVTYHKTAQWLGTIEQKLGADAFRHAMQGYYAAWQFRHPYPEDLRTAFEPALGSETSTYFNRLQEKGSLPGTEPKGFQVIFPFRKDLLKQYGRQVPKDALLLSPAIGYNRYDGFMGGLLLTNYKLPPSGFQYLLAPLYGFGSSQLNGLATFHYTRYTDRHALSFGIGAMRFSRNERPDSSGGNIYERFYRLTPQVQLRFRGDARSTRQKSLEAKLFFIGEETFNYVMRKSDSLIFADRPFSATRYVSQLTYEVSDERVLYPYNYRLQLQQGESFARINATASFFFNYARGGGLDLRVFGAKFFTLNGKERENFLYRPKLLGLTGEEDFTYGNYFAGRTASDALEAAGVSNGGLPARQIMIRDGGLKLRVDGYESVQGRSENWVAAVNLRTTLPNNLLPFKLPLRLFFDAGTYGEAWDSRFEGSRFLFVGGVQLTLLKVINIYAPLIYNSEIDDYLGTLPEKNTFWNRLTFSIDLQELNFRRLTGYNLF